MTICEKSLEFLNAVQDTHTNDNQTARNKKKINCCCYINFLVSIW